MFQGLVGFIGPVGEAGLAGEKVIICGVFFPWIYFNSLYKITLKRKHWTCAILGRSRGDGPSWTTWRKGTNGKTEWQLECGGLSHWERMTFESVKTWPQDYISKEGILSLLKILRNGHFRLNCVCYSHGNIVLWGIKHTCTTRIWQNMLVFFPQSTAQSSQFRQL